MNGEELKSKYDRLAEVDAELSRMSEIPSKEKRSFNPEEKAAYKSFLDEKETLGDEIETAELVAQNKVNNKPEIAQKRSDNPVVDRNSKRGITTADHDDAWRSWWAHGTRNSVYCRSKYDEAAKRVGVNYESSDYTFALPCKQRDAEYRNQSFLANADGLYVKDGALVKGFARAVDYFWSWQQYCTVWRTPDGRNDFNITRSDDTGNDAAYTAELGTLTNVNIAYQAPISLKNYKLSTAVYSVSNEFVRDAPIDVLEHIGYVQGRRLARKIAKEVTIGDGGTGHWTGFVGQTHLGFTAASQTAITFPELQDFHMALNPAFYEDPSRIYMCHPAIWAKIWKLLDGNDRPLVWDSGSSAMTAPRFTLFGVPVVFNTFLPSTTAADAKVLYYGSPKAINVRLVGDTIFGRSQEGTFFTTDSSGFVSHQAGDSKFIDAGDHPFMHFKMAAA